MNVRSMYTLYCYVVLSHENGQLHRENCENTLDVAWEKNFRKTQGGGTMPAGKQCEL